ncbi:prominin-1-A-like isoform X5 [Erpetoichthys calabaricus]|uniref:prominin-1-A-like isoform X5 n=1 Tax=Erpetoichthys calabaricus TaxID=27687 RepID=UPI0022344824|nr:prominin-1-A-like isoform X5 [Erpetoichthys calabaricus]
MFPIMMGRMGLVFALLWGCTLCEMPSSVHQTAQGTLNFGDVPAVVYETHAYYEPGPIGILFHMVHAFLYVVQPNPFPRDLITSVAQQRYGDVRQQYQKPENVVLTLKAIYYELGFIICASLGILFILIVPVVGLFFCLCRCCDNCGGEMHQRQKKNAECQRGCFVTFLFVTSVMIFAGVLCAYVANQNLSSELKGVRHLVNSNFRDLHMLLNHTPAQIEYMVSQYTIARSKIVSDLDNIGPLLGNRIHEQLAKDVFPALDGALNMAGTMRETKESLENVNSSLEVLREANKDLQQKLSNVQANLRNTLNDPACSAPNVSRTCSSIRNSLVQLSINANFNGLPDVNTQLSNVKKVLKTDLSNIVQKGYSMFNDTPNIVKNQTKSIIAGVKTMLDSIGANITALTKQYHIQNLLDNLALNLSYSQSYVQDYFALIDQYDFYRWLGCLVMCCLVALILAFNFLGILCGYCGYDKHASPTTRGCISNTGGNLLMAGAGFSFIFSWLLMSIVVITFTIGGNFEKLVCEPFHNKALFKVIDTPYLINPVWKNFLPGFLYQDPEINLTFESLYSECKQNNGVYGALQLEHIFNVSKFLNTSIYTKNVLDMLGNINVNMSAVILLEDAGRQNLINFTQTGIGSINYPAYLAEINKGITKVDLLSFANDLEAQADQLAKGALENALKGHASNIRSIHSQQVIPMEQAMRTLSQNIQFLQRTASDLPTKVNDVLSSIAAAQYLVSQNATYVIIQETENYMDVIVSYFIQYLNWVKNSLSFEVATCKPIANVVDTADIFICNFVVDSLNTFWFGLGCSTVFLIPSIVISVKLAKFYRRMDTEDVYDDNETITMKTITSYDTMTRFPQASAPPRQAEW